MSTGKRGMLGSLVVGLALIVLGTLLLLEAVFRINVWGLLWPMFVLGPGLAFFAAMVLQGRGRGGGWAVPASILTAVGLILFVQNLLDLWATWAYVWTLAAPTAVGAGLMIQGWWNRDGTRIAEGRRVATTGLLMFVFLMVFFEFALNLSGLLPRFLARLVGPLLVIALGAVLLARAVLSSARNRVVIADRSGPVPPAPVQPSSGPSVPPVVSSGAPSPTVPDDLPSEGSSLT